SSGVPTLFEAVLTHARIDSLAAVHHRTTIHPLARPAAQQLPAKGDDRLPSFLLNEYIGTVHIECFSHVAIIIDMVGPVEFHERVQVLRSCDHLWLLVIVGGFV